MVRSAYRKNAGETDPEKVAQQKDAYAPHPPARTVSCYKAALAGTDGVAATCEQGNAGPVQLHVPRGATHGKGALQMLCVRVRGCIWNGV